MFRVVLIIALLMFSSLARPESTSEKIVKIDIGFDLWPGYFPIIIAKERGLFSKRKLSVNYYIPENTDAMLNRFTQGGLDAICVAAGDIFSILPQSPEMRITLIADLSAGGDALLSLSPLPRTLNGLLIGTNMGGFGELFVDQFLKDHHAQIQDITLVNIEASEAHQLLRSKAVDIAHTWEPYVTQAKDDGARVVYTSRQTPGLIPDIVAFHGDFIQQHPQSIKDFNAAWLEAVDWWQRNPKLGNQIIQQRLVLKSPVSTKGIKLMTAVDNLDAFNNLQSPRALPRVIDRYIDFFVNNGTLPAKIPASQVIDGRYLPYPTSDQP